MPVLDERRREILFAIIQSHIELNVPIGSALLKKRYPIDLSPASVRSIMASLEKMGYIKQPHTSAGRIPTEKGLRFYVDTLLEEQSTTESGELLERLSRRLNIAGGDNSSLLQIATQTLSHLSHYMAIAIPPKTEDLMLKHIKFIRYDTRKVLSVIISDEGLVRNIFIELEKEFSQQQLDEAALYINTNFAGTSIADIRDNISYELHREKAAYHSLVSELIFLFQDSILLERDNLFLQSFSGTSYLADFADLAQIKEILKAIEGKYFMLNLLKLISRPSGTQVFVGMESIMPAMKELSMVISTFRDKRMASGAIGIIGPTRMNYERLIPIVNHTAKALTHILSDI